MFSFMHLLFAGWWWCWRCDSLIKVANLYFASNDFLSPDGGGLKCLPVCACRLTPLAHCLGSGKVDCFNAPHDNKRSISFQTARLPLSASRLLSAEEFVSCVCVCDSRVPSGSLLSTTFKSKISIIIFISNLRPEQCPLLD